MRVIVQAVSFYGEQVDENEKLYDGNEQKCRPPSARSDVPQSLDRDVHSEDESDEERYSGRFRNVSQKFFQRGLVLRLYRRHDFGVRVCVVRYRRSADDEREREDF